MKFSVAQLVVGVFVLAMAFAVFMPSVKINAKSDKAEVWTSNNEQKMRSQCPPISSTELNRR